MRLLRTLIDHGLAVIWEAVHPSNDLMTLLVNDLKLSWSQRNKLLDTTLGGV
jgi:hypothetical protein